MTDFAGNIDIREELHLNFDDAVAMTSFAASALYIEAESSRLIPSHLGF